MERSNVNSAQKECLVEYLEKNRSIVTGKITKDFTQKDGRRLWEELAENLNALPGANKDWKSWRKVSTRKYLLLTKYEIFILQTWYGLKNEVRKKAAAIKKHVGGTGGGQPTSISLSLLEERIRALTSETTIVGHSTVPVNAIHIVIPVLYFINNI